MNEAILTSWSFFCSENLKEMTVRAYQLTAAPTNTFAKEGTDETRLLFHSSPMVCMGDLYSIDT